jgi:hypothetical protein
LAAICTRVGIGLVPIFRRALSASSRAFTPLLHARAEILMVFAEPNTQGLLLIYRFAFLRGQHLPPNDAPKSQQHEGEPDLDPLSHGGSMECSPAEIEKTMGWLIASCK